MGVQASLQFMFVYLSLLLVRIRTVVPLKTHCRGKIWQKTCDWILNDSELPLAIVVPNECAKFRLKKSRKNCTRRLTRDGQTPERQTTLQIADQRYCV